MSTSSPSPENPRIALLTTGGTISSSTDSEGVVRNDVGRGAPELPVELAAQLPAGLSVEAREVFSVDSSQMTDEQRLLLCRAIDEALSDPEIAGVVVTHGTDSMADSAMAADLYHRDPRPVVFTGAQHAADHPAPDGPANLFDAYQVVLSESAHGLGTLVVFGRAIMQARGVAKWHTTDELAFARNAQDETPAASGSNPGSSSSAERPTLDLPAEGIEWPRVECVWAGSGASATALEALIDSGIAGYVLVAMGLGNLPASVAEVAAAHSEIPFALTSTVPRGAVVPTYGGPGGGAELATTGALPTGWLRGGQARVTLAALLADAPGESHAERARRFAGFAGLPA
ncbi:asparaginase [Dietzia sp.]|uniref:asparaginase n=1 Tax=Dietzia sp. TaxID=1871616 RepID=UPI002FD89498